jgi:hypothetical protein
MNTPALDRDPVAVAIEALLVEMQSKGMGSIYQKSTTEGIAVAFGDSRAEGKTLDMALVRLANAMMDDVKYNRFGQQLFLWHRKKNLK